MLPCILFLFFYLVEFFLAEPLVLAGEVFIVDSKMMLEVVPGPGDDGPP